MKDRLRGKAIKKLQDYPFKYESNTQMLKSRRQMKQLESLKKEISRMSSVENSLNLIQEDEKNRNFITYEEAMKRRKQLEGLR